MLLTVVVVAYNSASAIAQALRSLRDAVSHLEAEIVVLDNASSDGSAAVAESVLGEGGVVLQMVENLGYGAAVNHVARMAQGKYLLMMNDDVLVEPATVDRLIATLEENLEIAMVGPLLKHPDGSPTHTMHRWLPGWRDEWARVGDRLRGTRHRLDLPASAGLTEVGALFAACALIETAYFLEIGGFNDAFFVYGEDLDLCRRIASFGRRVAVDSRAVAVHHQDEGFDRRPKGWEFSRRLRDARSTYYRIWLPRPSRMLLNVWHMFGRADQPFRAMYHLRRAAYDGESLSWKRRPKRLQSLTDQDQ